MVLPTAEKSSKKIQEELQKVIFQHSKSFSFATAFLPKKQREAIRTLYAFCRFYDNLVDEQEKTTTEEITKLQDDFRSPNPQIFINQEFRKIIDCYQIPENYPDDLIEGCKRDLQQSSYESFAELCDYCYQVASTVGIVSAYILGFNKEKERQVIHYATKAGVALQLTNIIRDVGEDLKRGRTYLPKEDFVVTNCNYQKPSSWSEDFAFKQVIAIQLLRAKNLYSEGRKGLKYLNPIGRFSVAIALRVYEEILKRVEKNDYDVLSQRAWVPFDQKLQLMPLALWDSLIG